MNNDWRNGKIFGVLFAFNLNIILLKSLNLKYSCAYTFKKSITILFKLQNFGRKIKTG